LDGKDSRMSTIVVRGATDNFMDDIERAIDDGVNTFKGISRVCLSYKSFWYFECINKCFYSHFRMENYYLALEP